jgi:hypothetical protein
VVTNPVAFTVTVNGSIRSVDPFFFPLQLEENGFIACNNPDPGIAPGFLFVTCNVPDFGNTFTVFPAGATRAIPAINPDVSDNLPTSRCSLRTPYLGSRLAFP